MRNALVVASLAAASWTPVPSYSATGSVTSTGDCNANISGSGNTVFIECASGEEDRSPEAKMLFVGDHQPVVRVANFNPSVVDLRLSEFRLYVNGDYIGAFDLDDQWEAEEAILRKGRHTFKMTVKITYLNGWYYRTECDGFLSVGVGAVVMPRVLIANNWNTGEIYPVNCWFEGRGNPRW